DQVLRRPRCKFKVVLIKRLDDGEGRHTCQGLPAAHLPGIALMCQCLLQEVQEAVVLLSGLACDGFEALSQAIELELPAVAVDAFRLQIHACTPVRISW